MRRLQFALFTGILFVATLISANIVRGDTAQALSAANWNAGRIIDDRIFADSQAISVSQIQAFLNAKVPSCDTNGSKSSSHWYDAGGRYYTRAEWGAISGNPAPYVCLKDYVENLSTGQNNLGSPGASVPGGLSAAQIIAGASTQYSINPEVIVVLLQKEQSLVTDDWPWVTQYKKATGAFCPDTAPCDVQHAGFGNQVYSAARLFRNYIDNPGQYNHAPGNNNILYNPNADCGRSIVHIETRATAALYNYTPYQPNAAALANLYGSGDGCSSYGNRNFWRMFNDWFGSTTGSVSVVKKSNDATIYFRDKNTIRPIPSMSVLEAWGFTGDMVSTLDDTTFNTLSVVTPNLSRVVKVTGTSDIFFVDGGNHYYVNPAVAGLRGFSASTALGLPATTIQSTFGKGNLSAAVTAASGDTSVYIIDGAQKRGFTSMTVLKAWLGSSPTITRLSNSYVGALASAPNISLNRIEHNGSTYLVDGKKKLPLSANAGAIYPGSTTAVSANIDGYLATGPGPKQLARAANGSVYLIDAGIKHPVGSLKVANAWKSGEYANLSNHSLSLIPTGSTWSKNIVRKNDGSIYLVDSKKYLIPTDLTAAYLGGTTAPTVSDNLLALLPNSAGPASGFLKATTNSTIYLADYGKKRPISSFTSYSLLNGARNETITNLRSDTLSLISSGPVVNSLPSDGSGGLHVFDNGSYYSLAPDIAQEWQAASSAALHATSLSRYVGLGALGNKLRDGSTYGVAYDGKFYRSSSLARTAMWGLNDTSTQAVSSAVLSTFKSTGGLTRFIKKNNSLDSTVYLIDNNQLFPIASMNLYVSLGPDSIAYLPESVISTLDSSTNASFATTTAGETYVFDNGKKRIIESSYVNFWFTSGNAPASYSSEFLSLMPNNSALRRVIRTSDGSMYVMDAGQKRPIRSYSSFASNFASEGYSNISNSLAHLIPTGADF
jgi:hypothetical protein